jgi:hypothetical protein
MTFTPSGKTKGAATHSGKSSNSVSSWIVVFILVIIFFTGGVYVGSLVLSEGDLNSQSGIGNGIGLPGTYNIISALNKEVDILNKEAHEFLRKELHHDSTAVESPAALNLSNLRKEKNEVEKPKKIAPSSGTVLKADLPVSSTAPATYEESVVSFVATDSCYISAPSNLDAEPVLIAGWIYLDSSPEHDNDMRTIYSNKSPGCESKPSQNGISMYVNGWQTKDHKLYIEYGGSTSGCQKVSSESEISLGRWTHVASYLTPSSAALFINGEIATSQSIQDPHIVQLANPVRFGQYSTEAPYPFFGNLSHFVVSHEYYQTDALAVLIKSLSNEKTAMEAIKNPENKLFAYYPFDYHKKEKFAKDELHGNHGTYLCLGGNAEGLKIPIVDGVDGRPVTDEMKAESDRQGQIRKEKIKDGMKHVWKGYQTYAWGRDELKPLSNSGQDNWGGMGMTILDSLDTLWIMGMKAEFDEAKHWIESNLNFGHVGTVSVFEITIRALGGLLAAYDLSKERVFLDKAKDLGDRLVHAFSTRTGIPTGMINLATSTPSNGWSGNSAILSELGTVQVEFRYLAHHLKSSSYETTAMKPMKLMASKNPPNGLFPIKVRNDDGGFADSMITFGALGDSFYEYLLKVWIQGGKKEKWLRDMYDKAMDGAINKLLMSSTPTGLAFFSDWNGFSNFRKMDHLVCFVPGMLALGAYTDPHGLDSPRAQRDLTVAKAMMYTCREMYHRTQTGIAPEYVEFPNGRDMIPAANAPFYILRPETAESLFILNQLTGDPIYRDWAWEIWEAIDRECRTKTGYGALRHVNNRNAGVDDRMESFFLAETMKYLYLAQDPDKPVDLMKVVFNTEAHPLSILDNSHTPVTL